MRRAFSTKAVSALSPPARNVCTSGETADDALDGDVLTARTTARLGLVTPVFVRSFRRDMVVRSEKGQTVLNCQSRARTCCPVEEMASSVAGLRDKAAPRARLCLALVLMATAASAETLQCARVATQELPGFLSDAAFMSDGLLALADSRSRVIRLFNTTSKQMSVLAGVESWDPVFRDGDAVSARFAGPTRLAVARRGILISDRTNGHNRIRLYDGASQRVSTVAGSRAIGFTDGYGTHAQFNNPGGLVVAASQDKVFVADESNHAVRELFISTGLVSTLAGSRRGIAGRADGPRLNAFFNTPTSLALAGHVAGGSEARAGETVLVTDSRNNIIRAVNLRDGTVHTGMPTLLTLCQ